MSYSWSTLSSGHTEAAAGTFRARELFYFRKDFPLKKKRKKKGAQELELYKNSRNAPDTASVWLEHYQILNAAVHELECDLLCFG